MKKISYYELTSVPTSELMKRNKMSAGDFERAVKDHVQRAPRAEREQFYKDVYSKNKG